MILNPRTDLYTLNFLLFALMFLLLLLGHVFKPAEIDDFCNRRGCSWRDEDKVQSQVLGHGKSLAALHNAYLFAFGANNS